jgi:hypothetical protein
VDMGFPSRRTTMFAAVQLRPDCMREMINLYRAWL